MNIGERWAFRRDRTSRWAEVQIKAVGVKRPPRVRVEFVEDRFEGKTEWVSPSRLEVLWDDLPAYDKRDRRWRALKDAPRPTQVEERAAEIVVPLVIGSEVATLSWTGYNGALVVYDLDALLAVLSWPADVLLGDELTIVEDGETWIPWRVTRSVIEELVPRQATQIFQKIEARERDDQRKSVTGYDFRWTRNSELISIPGEVAARYTEKHQTPVFDQVRRWIGSETSTDRDELVELRREVARLGRLTQRAINKVRELRSPKFADQLEHELLNPPGPYPGYGEDSDRAAFKSMYHWVKREDD